MNEREKLMCRLSAHQFSMWEMHMYLDTHVGDPEAIRSFRQHEAEYKTLKKEYEEKYGPLNPSSGNGAEWIKNPWPWDIDKEDC